MKVCLYPSDNTGCGLYRMYYPAAGAAQHGLQVQLVEQQAPVDYFDRHGQMCARARDPDADVVVLQRVVSMRIARLIPILQRLGHAVVVDIDDDLSCLHPSHPAFARVHPKLSPEHNWHWLAKACRAADLVTVPTRQLAERFAGHGRVAVLPNCVPARLLDMPRASDGMTVGWSGWTRSHPGDLAVTHGGVAQALARSGAQLKVIGLADGVSEELGLAQEPKATGGLDIEDYYAALGSLDVALIPLADTRFNAGKGHKGLELAARGVAFVASPTAGYPALAAEGIGQLAPDRARSWRAALTRLLADAPARVALAQGAREAVRARHTYEGQSWRWAQAWEQAIANRAPGDRARVRDLVS